jgi:hypothetical protein
MAPLVVVAGYLGLVPSAPWPNRAWWSLRIRGHGDFENFPAIPVRLFWPCEGENERKMGQGCAALVRTLRCRRFPEHYVLVRQDAGVLLRLANVYAAAAWNRVRSR